jgi:ribosomal protein S18 acetylase RimI-like enzyme
MLIKYKHNKGCIQGSYEMVKSITDNVIYNKRRGIIHNLWVKKQFRNKKIGQNLLKKMIEQMYEIDILHIELDDVSDNFRSHNNIYLKHGFKYKYKTGPEMYANTRHLILKIKKID